MRDEVLFQISLLFASLYTFPSNFLVLIFYTPNFYPLLVSHKYTSLKTSTTFKRKRYTIFLPCLTRVLRGKVSCENSKKRVGKGSTVVTWSDINYATRSGRTSREPSRLVIEKNIQSVCSEPEKWSQDTFLSIYFSVRVQLYSVVSFQCWIIISSVWTTNY